MWLHVLVLFLLTLPPTATGQFVLSWLNCKTAERAVLVNAGSALA